LKKHSVSFDEDKTVFNDPLARITQDNEHSISEHRWNIIGLSKNNRIIITAFTERKDRIRIISALKRNLLKEENMKNTKTYKETEDFEIPPFDFENSKPNKYKKLYTEDNQTIILKSNDVKTIVLDSDIADYFRLEK
jgi:uncharacterized DUF497 family protein